MIDLDAADPGAFYDPDPLKVGDRVRVRLNGECRNWYEPFNWAAMGLSQPGFWSEHDLVEHGLTGVVEEISREDEHGHYYGVKTDSRWQHLEDGRSWECAFDLFARVELERIS